jgi:hypothetical protein
VKRKLPADSVLRRLYVEEGLTQQQIADRYGVGWTAVHKMLRHLGVPRRRRGERDLGKHEPVEPFMVPLLALGTESPVYGAVCEMIREKWGGYEALKKRLLRAGARHD